jgi:hypothetical protein
MRRCAIRHRRLPHLGRAYDLPGNQLIDQKGNPVSYDDSAVPGRPAPWTPPPDIWALHRWCPDAVNAAYRDLPIAAIWHFQL